MKTQALVVVLRTHGREFSAQYHHWTGRLIVTDGVDTLEELRPPDSWMAIASLNCDEGWGTRPSLADLQAFLERYVASTVWGGST